MAAVLGFSLGDSSVIDIQRFGPDFKNGSRVGVNTWVRPARFKPRLVHVYLCGAGGVGGSGAMYPSSTYALGGGGGTGGELIGVAFDAAALGSAVTVTIGDAGTSGPAQTTNSDWGFIGGDGGASSFGAITARGGLANPTRAVGGSNTLAATTFPASGNRPGGNTGTGNTYSAWATNVTYTAVGVGVPRAQAPLGGGSGGQARTAGNYSAGGNGVPQDTWIGTIPADNKGYLGDSTAGVPGNAVSLAPTLIPWYSGGGGAGGNYSGAGIAGGNGRFGSGAGGGGGSVGGVSSGAGGVGGYGFCVVVSYG